MNEVLTKIPTITLDWNDVAGATKYHAQISPFLDFSRLDFDNDNLLISEVTHSVTSGERKYFWRWKAFVAGTWQKWSEVSSFIYDSTIAQSVTTTGWKLVNKPDTTDFYDFELFLLSWEDLPEHMFRTIGRNRKGILLDEWYATKSRIELDISRRYLGPNEKAEILRFYHMHRSFYLVTRLENQKQDDYIYRAWEVMFTRIPELERPGRNVLTLEEI